MRGGEEKGAKTWGFLLAHHTREFLQSMSRKISAAGKASSAREPLYNGLTSSADGAGEVQLTKKKPRRLKKGGGAWAFRGERQRRKTRFAKERREIMRRRLKGINSHASGK